MAEDLFKNREARRENAWMDRDWENYPPRNFSEKLILRFKKVVGDPVVKFRRFLLSLRMTEPYYWYHKQYRRVPTVDQCYEHDVLCRWEADEQLKRDRKLDSYIIMILRERYQDCMVYERREREKCRPMYDTLKENETNFFIKYGELPMGDIAYNVYMKQKHRMAWERRHGEVGTGMKKKYYRNDGSVYYA